MSQEIYILLYLESEKGIPISHIPLFCGDEDTGKSDVISARGNSFAATSSSIASYNNTNGLLWYFDIYFQKWRRDNRKNFFHYFCGLDTDQKREFWESLKDKSAPPYALYDVSNALKRFDEPSLNRALVLIRIEEPNRAKLDDELHSYLRLLSEEHDTTNHEKIRRISVGSEEVIADYLLTNFLCDKFDEASEAVPVNYLEVFDEAPPRQMGQGDFSYNENFEHLDPYYYEAYEYGFGCHKFLHDDFYYRFDHDQLELIQERSSIPNELEQSSSMNSRARLAEVFFNKILENTSPINEKVFAIGNASPEKSS